MKVVVTADIYFGVGNNQHIVKNLAKRIIKTNADVLILAGDTFHFRQQLLIDCLYLFDAFEGDKLFVVGNRDLWTNDADSLNLYEKILPKIVNQCDFHYLDQKPFEPRVLLLVREKYFPFLQAMPGLLLLSLQDRQMKKIQVLVLVSLFQPY